MLKKEEYLLLPHAIVGLPGGLNGARRIEIDVNLFKEEIFDTLKRLAKDNGYIAMESPSWPNRIEMVVPYQRELLAESIVRILKNFQLSKIVRLAADKTSDLPYAYPAIEVESFVSEAEVVNKTEVKEDDQ